MHIKIYTVQKSFLLQSFCSMTLILRYFCNFDFFCSWFDLQSGPHPTGGPLWRQEGLPAAQISSSPTLPAPERPPGVGCQATPCPDLTPPPRGRVQVRGKPLGGLFQTPEKFSHFKGTMALLKPKGTPPHRVQPASWGYRSSVLPPPDPPTASPNSRASELDPGTPFF